jgi:hypothetical protein
MTNMIKADRDVIKTDGKGRVRMSVVRKRFDFRSLGFGHAFEEVLQIFCRIDAQAPATAQYRVYHRAPLAASGWPMKRKCFLPMAVGRMAFSAEKVVRARGLEPPILAEPDPKSGVSAIPPRAQP